LFSRESTVSRMDFREQAGGSWTLLTGPRPAQGKEDMLRVQVHDADPASRNGQARTAGLDGQDIPGGGADSGWPHRPGNGLWLVR
jgi:hypothetical protein